LSHQRQYHDGAQSCFTAAIVQPAVVGKQLKVEGFLVPQYRDKFPEGLKDMATWIAQVNVSFFLSKDLNGRQGLW